MNVPSVYTNDYKVDVQGKKAAGKLGVRFMLPGSAEDNNAFTLSPAELAEALNGIIPGFECKYTEPVEVPTYTGAVVESRNGFRYALIGNSETDGLVWVGESGFVKAELVRAILGDGGKVITYGDKNAD